MKKIIVILTVIIILVLVGFFLAQVFEQDYAAVENETPEEVVEEENQPEEEEVTQNETETVIAKSVGGRDITAFHFGEGDKEILLVGGIHGGYSWNTVLLNYRFMDYLEDNVPEGLKVSVIPVLNPDGLNETVGSSGQFDVAAVPDDPEDTVSGRFNANGVDLNRNFDCQWEPTGTWQSREVDAGENPFSEPETAGLRDYIERTNPDAVVMYYSAAGGVFASNCGDGVMEETTTLTRLYSDASGYTAYEDFDFYEVTGDAVNWMAKNNIPAISILLATHINVEWDQNRNGLDAILEFYAE